VSDSLQSINPRIAYNKFDNEDIVSGFFDPCFGASRKYYRATGYFRSSVYSLIWNGLRNFVENNGEIKLICSHNLVSKDLDKIHEGYDNMISDHLNEELKKILQDPHGADCLKVLSSLISNNVLDIRIAVINNKTITFDKLFHDKFGIFIDGNDDKIVFHGSLNESFSAYSNLGNYESISTFASWDLGRDGERAIYHYDRFMKIWNNKSVGIETIKVPSEFSKELAKYADSEWPKIIKKYLNPGSKTLTIKERDHQKIAVKKWLKNNHRGILKHATASGKTVTAIMAMKKLKELKENTTFLILVPTELLLYQWEKEIGKFINDPKILLCGDNNNKWKNKSRLSMFLSQSNQFRVAISINDTAGSDKFLNQLKGQLKNLMVVADEVHTLGTNTSQNILNGVKPSSVLGLSATPERFADPDGTDRIFKYFGGIIDEYTLKDAIKDKWLTEYFYYPELCDLTEFEQSMWDKLTKQISKLYAMSLNSKSDDFENKLQSKIHERSRIIRGAQNKFSVAVDIVKNNFEPKSNQKWLIYCDTIDQIGMLNRILKDEGFNPLEYHSKMEGDRKATMDVFKDENTIMTSANCLDQGVDIPAVSHAVLISSSQNPRQHIQRRGRVLRKYSGKLFSYIYDLLILPSNNKPPVDDEEYSIPNIALEEIKRSVQFSDDSVNPHVIRKIDNMLFKRNINLDLINESGVEDE